MCDSNSRPLSVVIWDGTPYLAIHVESIVFATIDAVMSGIGTASGHLESRLTIVTDICFLRNRVRAPPSRSVCAGTLLRAFGIFQVPPDYALTPLMLDTRGSF